MKENTSNKVTPQKKACLKRKEKGVVVSGNDL
jgi:hypothetical protein